MGLNKPDGSPRKKLDVSLLSSLGWECKVNLTEGLKEPLSIIEMGQAQSGIEQDSLKISPINSALLTVIKACARRDKLQKLRNYLALC